MRISPVSITNGIGSIDTIASAGKAEVSQTGPGGVSFKDEIKKAVMDVNDLQSQADQASGKLAVGDIQDVHEAMIAMQKAKLALEFTIQVRNKVIEAYQEIMRMQV